MTQNRVVLVTGGMGGLGETISTKMVDAGYKVAVTYSPGNTTARRMGRADEGERLRHSTPVPCDVTDCDSCASAVAQHARTNSARSTYWSTTPASRAT